MTDHHHAQKGGYEVPELPLAPNGSRLTYAFVGASLAAAVLAAIAAYLDISLLRFPVTSVVLLIAAALLGLVVHAVRTHRHGTSQGRATSLRAP